MNFFKLYIGDYQRDTGHLSVAEHGAYLLMLQHYYATEKPLPTGKALYRLLRASERHERDAIDTVSNKFWVETPEGLINERALKEFARASEIAETNRLIALRREAKRRERKEHEACSSRGTNEARTDHEQSTNHSQTPDSDTSLRSVSERATRLPKDWALPDDWIPVAIEIGVPAGAVIVESEKFRDHWLAKSGKDATKRDWLATWRTWCRNAVQWTYRPETPRGTNQPARLSAVERAIADNERHRQIREGSTGLVLDG